MGARGERTARLETGRGDGREKSGGRIGVECLQHQEGGWEGARPCSFLPEWRPALPPPRYLYLDSDGREFEVPTLVRIRTLGKATVNVPDTPRGLRFSEQPAEESLLPRDPPAAGCGLPQRYGNTPPVLGYCLSWCRAPPCRSALLGKVRYLRYLTSVLIR